MRDGHLIWRAQAELGMQACRRTALALDHDGNVIVGGFCNDATPVILEYRGADGSQAWLSTAADTCEWFQVFDVAVDASNDVYASGLCRFANGVDQLTVKLDATNGNTIWAQHTEGTDQPSLLGGLSRVPQQLTFASDSVFVAANVPIIGDPNGAVRVVVSRLNSTTGVAVWATALQAPSGGFFSLDALETFPNGDPIVVGYPFAARLDAATGTPRWSNYATPGGVTQMVVDANGDAVFSGGSAVWKLRGTNGTQAWVFQEPRVHQYNAINDVTIASNGSIYATGSVDLGTPSSGSRLYAVALDPADGQVLWSLADEQPNYDQGICILESADGAILVAADHALMSASPWSLVRLTGPFADGIFANGLEE